MTEHRKYLVTVDPESRKVVKVEHLGEAGELTEVPMDALKLAQPPTAVSYTVNVYMGGADPRSGGTVHFPGTPEHPVFTVEDIPGGTPGNHIRRQGAPDLPED